MARPLDAPPTPPIRGGQSWIPIGDITFAFSSVFIAVLIALVAAFALVPESRQWLAASDGLISWIAAATLALAVAVGTWAFGRSTADSRFRVLIPAAAALLLLQSLRFGATTVGFRLPTVEGIEVGSLVDLRRLTSVAAERLGLGWPAGVLILMLVAIITGLNARSASKWAADRVRITDTPVVAYFVVALGLEAAIPVLGFFGEGVGAWFATTILGLVGAGLLVLAGLASGDHRTIVAGWRRRIGPRIVAEGTRSRFPIDTR